MAELAQLCMRCRLVNPRPGDDWCTVCRAVAQRLGFNASGLFQLSSSGDAERLERMGIALELDAENIAFAPEPLAMLVNTYPFYLDTGAYRFAERWRADAEFRDTAQAIYRLHLPDWHGALARLALWAKARGFDLDNLGGGS